MRNLVVYYRSSNYYWIIENLKIKKKLLFIYNIFYSLNSNHFQVKTFLNAFILVKEKKLVSILCYTIFSKTNSTTYWKHSSWWFVRVFVETNLLGSCYITFKSHKTTDERLLNEVSLVIHYWFSLFSKPFRNYFWTK